MKILAIETSCDDTSVGIIAYENNMYTVESLLAYSQIQDHQSYGGVVPEIASRNHIEAISGVTKQALEDAKITFEDIDIIYISLFIAMLYSI